MSGVPPRTDGAGGRVLLSPGTLLLLASLLTAALFLAHFAHLGFGVYGDGLGYYAPLRSLLFDGGLKVSNEYRHFAEIPGRWPLPIPRHSKYPLGMGLVLLPFFLAGHLVALLLNATGLFPGLAADGFSWPYELLYCAGSAALGILGLLIGYRAARSRFGRFPAVLAVAGVWFASPLSYYLIIDNSMSHAVSQFLIAAFLGLIMSGRWLADRRQQILLGLLLGLAASVRLQDAVFAVVPAVLAATGWRREEGGGRLSSLGVMALSALAAVAPQMLIYVRHFGSVSRIPYLTEGRLGAGLSSFDWLHPKIIPVLFSGFHGLFSWHPLMLLATLGLILALRADWRFALALIAALAAQVYVTSSWFCWWGAWSLGGRMFSSCGFIFIFGLAALWERARGPGGQALAVAVTAFFMLWNALLALQFMSGMIPPGDPVPMGELVANQFKVLPFLLAR